MDIGGTWSSGSRSFRFTTANGRYLLVEPDSQQRTAGAVPARPGGLRMHTRSRRTLEKLIIGMADPTSESDRRRRLPRRSGRWRLLLGMVLANRRGLLVPGLMAALGAALTTGAIATINPTVWLLAGSLSCWRLVVATITSVSLVFG